jgi:SAM-dependent methyltransferase
MSRMVVGNGAYPDTPQATGAVAATLADRPPCPACAGTLDAPALASSDRLTGRGTFSVARCERCGLGVTLPVADSAQLACFYPTTYVTHERPARGVVGAVSTVVERMHAWHAWHVEPLRRLAELPAGRVLDVGCGRGDLGTWLTQRGWLVVGVEPSARACAVARSRGIDARTGTLEEVELESRAYDAVIFRQSLEHVAEPLGDLRRARQALRDGGVAIVSVPNFGCWQSRRFGACWFHLDVPRHRFHFNAECLRTLLVRAGFARVETVTSSSSVGLPASVQYLLAGRCLFPTGLRLRAAFAVCTAATPFIWLLDQLLGEGEVLHAVAHTR